LTGNEAGARVRPSSLEKGDNAPDPAETGSGAGAFLDFLQPLG